MLNIIFHLRNTNQTTVKNHFTLTRMALRKTHAQMLARIWRTCNAHMLQIGMRNGPCSLENFLTPPLKVKHQVTI